jgi:hypothetical protein
MQTTIDIDEDILQAAAERSRVTGQTPGEIISGLARFAMELDRVEKLPKRNGFPQLEFDPTISVTPELIDQILNESE